MKEFKIVSFNIRCEYDRSDGINCFVHRAGMILDKISMEDPDVICFQEVTEKIRRFLNKHLSGYTLLGHGRDKDLGGEGVSIAYKTEKFDLVSLEHFWLSPTPNVPASRFDDQSPCPRTCPHAVLLHKEYKKLINIYGVHLDYDNEHVRTEGMQVILDRIDSDGGITDKDAPMFILGDFNAFPDEETIALCNNHKNPELAEVSKNSGETFHSFGRLEKNHKIDYIFTQKNVAKHLTSLDLWTDEMHGIYLSDHYPVSCTFDFENL